MMPSREFLVRQSILNAARWYWPATVEMEGMTKALTHLAYGNMITVPFRDAITREYHKLVERNWEPLA
tara:strand:- start:165 stop:368 length:204 start_codon:yes stop_codon:yes gene_type:complete